MRPEIYEVTLRTGRETLATVTGPARDKAEAGTAALAIVRYLLKMQ